MRSSGGESSWEPTIDIHADVHEVLFDPASGLVLAASARGLAVSADGGKSWRFDTQGLHANYLRSVVVAGETVLVGASTGPRTNHAAVYRAPLNGGATFERCRDGLPERFLDNIDTLCLASSGSQVAFGTSDGSVFVSSDEGKSWSAGAGGTASGPMRGIPLMAWAQQDELRKIETMSLLRARAPHVLAPR